MLLVFMAVLPAAALATTLIWLNYREEQMRLQRDLIAAARALVHAVDSELTGITLAAQVLATSPHLNDSDLQAFYDQAKAIVDQQIGNNVVLSDAGGQQLVNTLLPFGDQLPLQGDPKHHLSFETGQPIVSDVYVSRLLQRHFVRVDVPVWHEGQVVYNLSIGAFPQRFGRLLRDAHLPEGWIATLFDAKGTIASRTHQMDRFLGQQESPDLVKRMGQVSEDAILTTTIEGIPVLFAFSRSDFSKWVVAIGIPSAELAKQLWSSLIWLILGLALLLFTSIWFGWRISEQISRAIDALIAPALELGRGKAVTVPPLRLKEANEVGQALTRASRMLQDANYRANHDPLTQLPNRELFQDIAVAQLAACQREGSGLGILYVDLDDFKHVNDRYGHAVGDELLCAVATKLRNAVRRSDLVARLGGDEFAVLLFGVQPSSATAVANHLIEVLSRPFALRGATLQVSASVGIAVYPNSGNSIPMLLSRADAAMYKAKKEGKRQAALAEDM
jgi:diguanylate cyclase (GGDEF)-like protein